MRNVQQKSKVEPEGAELNSRLSRRISSKSLFGDEIWEIDDHNPASLGSRIRWKAVLYNGSSLGSVEKADLLDTCKEYVYQRMLGTGNVSKLKPATAAKHATQLLQICAWMHEAGLTKFAQIGQYEVEELRASFMLRRGKWNVTSRKRSGNKSLTNKTIEMNIDALRGLVALADCLDDTPNWDPASDEGRLDLSKDPCAEIPAMPDDLAHPLLAEALRWVTEIAPLLLEARRFVSASIGERDYKRGRGEIYRRRRAFRKLTGTVYISGMAYHLHAMPRVQFNSFVRMLEAACFIIVAGFSGMRMSELSGLCVNCLESVRSTDNRTRLVLTGKLIKTASGLEQRERWVAGFDAPDNPVRVAVEVMTAICEVERGRYKLDALFLTNAFHNVNVPSAAERPVPAKLDSTPRPMTHGAMTVRLNEFKAFVGIESSWHLTTHQFRKTFARFVARHHRMAMLALKRQFKHISVSMTGIYHGTDIQLLELIGEERRIETREALEEILGSTFLGGKLGEQIVKSNECFRGQAGSVARGSYADAILSNGDVPLISTDIGFCFAFRDTARCGLDSAKQGVSGCLPCPNFIISLRHLPTWEDRLRNMDEFREQMIAEKVWSDVRQDDWKIRRDEVVSVIGRILKQLEL